MISSVALCTKTFDLNGRVFLSDVVENNSTLNDYRRRLTRTATLDTGAYIDDRGYFDGDRTIDVEAKCNSDLFNSVLYILQNYGSIWIMLPDGAYSGNIQRLTRSNGGLNLTLLIESTA